MDSQQLNAAIAEAYSPEWLYGEDLPRDATVEIEAVTFEKLRNAGKRKKEGDEPQSGKAILKFRGKRKRLALNVINERILEAIHGKEATGWVGKSITLTKRYGVWFGHHECAVRIVVPPGVQLTKSLRLLIEDKYGSEKPVA